MRILCCVLSASVFLATAPTSSNAFWSFRQKENEPNEHSKTADAVPEKQPKVIPDYGISGPAPPSRDPPNTIPYGVDVSLPIHHNTISNNYAWLPHNVDPSFETPSKYRDMPIQPLPHRQEFYDNFLESCVQAFGKKGQRCRDTERDRIEMSLRQPQSMQNYTEIGYKKIKAPLELFKLIEDFWNNNHHKAKPEQWGTGNTYTNNWQSSSSMVSVEDAKLRGGGFTLKQKIWNAAKNILQEWTGEELTQCSLYGIRIYHADAVLATHVDRLPLVSSAIINVAQDLDEPWPLEVIGHNGVAENVTMEPGDMVLYESHSVLHGRPFPLKGRYMANIFIHFEPIGHSLRHYDNHNIGDVDAKYRESLMKGHGGHENESNNGLPPYIIAGSPEEPHWRQSHPNGQQPQTSKTFTTGSTPAHEYAQKGNVDLLAAELSKQKDLVHAKDANDWTPLHEGARAGHLPVVKLLIEHGADVNAKTGGGSGGTPLWWARQTLEEDHEVISFLEEIGALDAGPEL
jgi:prolyl 4-hydroxylase